MVYFHWIAGTILALAWFSRIVDAALGMPSVADVSRPEWDRNPVLPAGNPRVSIIVPARNEEETIEQALNTLLVLDYDNYEVIAVNDRSTDRTGEIMERIAEHPHFSQKAREMGHPEFRSLPRGASSRTACGLARKNACHVDGGEPRYGRLACSSPMPTCLFKPDSLRRALAYAESVPADHVVLFPHMIMKRPGEYMMIAFFQTMFMFGHRPWKVADPSTDDHMGVGAFNLVRRRVYDAVGTYEALRMEVLDDMKLGKVVKTGGLRPAQRVWRRFDFDPLGQRRDGRGQQSDQELLCGAVVSMVADGDLGVRIGLLKLRTVSRCVSRPWMGSRTLCCGPGLDVPDLHRDVVALGGSAVLLPAASGQHDAVYLHAAAVDDSHIVE